MTELNLVLMSRESLELAAEPNASAQMVISHLRSAGIYLACALVRTRGVEIDASLDPDAHLIFNLSYHVEADGVLPVGSAAELKNLIRCIHWGVIFSASSIAHRLRWLRAFTAAAVPLLEAAVPGVATGLVENVDRVLITHVPAVMRDSVLQPWRIGTGDDPPSS